MSDYIPRTLREWQTISAKDVPYTIKREGDLVIKAYPPQGSEILLALYKELRCTR